MSSLSEGVVLDHKTKGVPGLSDPFELGAIGAMGWNVLRQDVPLPLAVLNLPTLERNIEWMRDFAAHAGVSLAPHGKTTMCPQLFREQIENGAWAMTLSTAHQVQVARDHGISRIVLANQLVDPTLIDFVASELDRDADFEFFCLVDSVDGVRILGERLQLRGASRPVQVLLEMGAQGGRTGARNTAQADEISDAIRSYETVIQLRGVEGFEGIFSGDPDEENVAKVDALLETIRATAESLDKKGRFKGPDIVLSAGGSAYFDRVVEQLKRARLSLPARVVTRSGCYVTHDAARYTAHFAAMTQRSRLVRETPGALTPALRVIAYVQSMPEPGLALLNAGKRDVSFDAGYPVPALYYSPRSGAGGADSPAPLDAHHQVFALNDQHAFVATPPDTPLRVGDMVMLDISHPCTTFDKWDVLYGVDDAFNIVKAYKTYF